MWSLGHWRGKGKGEHWLPPHSSFILVVVYLLCDLLEGNGDLAVFASCKSEENVSTVREGTGRELVNTQHTSLNNKEHFILTSKLGSKALALNNHVHL